MVVDATTVQLEDIPLNQEEYPQPSNSKPGCGFPVMQLVGLFNLGQATLEHLSYSPHNANEWSMFDVDLREHLNEGDVLMADRAYCSYLYLGDLTSRGVDVVMRLHGSRQWPRGTSGNDVLVKCPRPRASEPAAHITAAEWKDLPEMVTVRYLRYRLERAGFRTREVMLAQMYVRRWDIELCFDDIKTTIGMNFIHAQSPDMAVKLVSVYVIAHNLVRWLI